MFAAIFTAVTAQLDKQYDLTVAKMRELAFAKYNCVDFNAVSEGENEIAISYWHSLEDIKRWKSDPEHALAQKQGQKHWYKSYKVEVVEIKRAYTG